MASLEYDKSCNAMYLRLKRGKVAESEPISDNLILDLNAKHEIIGVEILGPSTMDVDRLSIPVKVVAKKRSAHAKN